jgi:hypothetical protein
MGGSQKGRPSTNKTNDTTTRYKRGCVGLTARANYSFLTTGALALFTVVPFRLALIEKPFVKKRVTYRFSKCLGTLAGEIWKRNTGILRPDGLIKIMSDKFKEDGNYHPFDFIQYTLHVLDCEISNLSENRSEVI